MYHVGANFTNKDIEIGGIKVLLEIWYDLEERSQR